MQHDFGRWAFLGGLVLAVVAGFVQLWWLPWVVGGIGIVVGLFNIQPKEAQTFLLAGVCLVVALTAILAQHYNPQWLSDVVFYARVFVAHVLLVVALIGVWKTAAD